MKLLGLIVALWLVAAPVRADEQPLYHLSVITAIAAHGSDLAITEHCLGAQTCHELNPWLGHWSTQPVAFGAMKMGVAAFSLWATSKIPNKTWATLANFGMTAAFAGIAYHNSVVLK